MSKSILGTKLKNVLHEQNITIPSTTSAGRTLRRFGHRALRWRQHACGYTNQIDLQEESLLHQVSKPYQIDHHQASPLLRTNTAAGKSRAKHWRQRERRKKRNKSELRLLRRRYRTPLHAICGGFAERCTQQRSGQECGGERERKRTWIRGRGVVRTVAAGGGCS